MFPNGNEASPASNSPEDIETLTGTDTSGDVMDDNSGDSSSPDDAKTEPTEPKSTAEMVEEALKGTGKSSTPVDQKDQGQKKNPDDPNASQAEGENGDEAGIPKEFHNHPRWKKLKAQRDEARQQAQAAKEQIETLQNDSTDLKAIVEFMDTNDLKPEEVAETLQWIALRNQNPEQFYIKFREIAMGIEEQFGGILPAELQQRVQNGEISHQDAVALNRHEARARLYQNRAMQQSERQAQQAQTQQSQNAKRQLADAANAWEQSQLTRDLDYKVKKPFIEAQMQALFLKHGWPKTPEELVQYADKALENVNGQLGTLMPKKQPTQLSPNGTRTVQTKLEPKNGEDIVRSVLGGG